jgi:queuine tRNA-ribosyltransferase
MGLSLSVEAWDGQARAGRLTTPHGTVDTPAFFPVATQATVKGVLPDELRAVGVQGLLANAYHLWQQPGDEVVARAGGLHRFMGWDRAIITDSGGFQVFSLAELREIDEVGVAFVSHRDGRPLDLTPERAVEIQSNLGSDVAMVLDICAPYPCSPADLKAAAERTVRWAQRSVLAPRASGVALFPIVQGGTDPGLREWCARELASLAVDGFGIGGFSVGEPRSQTWPALEAAIGPLPPERPRYLMGVGAPDDLVEGIARGVDVFDCVLPTRLGRHGTVLTPHGRLNLRAHALSGRAEAIDPTCDCLACTTFNVRLLHYLVRAGDPLGMRLASLHNIRALERLVAEARSAVIQGTFAEFRRAWFANRTPLPG